MVCVLSMVGGCKSGQSPVAEEISPQYPDQLLQKATNQALNNVDGFPADSLNIPRSIHPDGSLRGVKSRDWTSGFYAGTLWQLYAYSKDPKLKQAAQEWTAFQAKERFDDHTHDLGFKVYCSIGEGYKLTAEPIYKTYIIDAARQLIQRFNPAIGAIRSWDHNRDKWDYPVIIDNMMNLEMLFAATRLSGDSSFYQIALQHAQKTMENHFRADHSSYHVIDFHPDGQVRKRNTHQGHSHESAWARGQAWGLYGFTVAYRETQVAAFLTKAQEIAQFFFHHPRLPEDKVPYWDFDAPGIPEEERDASAAAIAASGLLELSQHDPQNASQYIAWADQILQSLGSEAYQAEQAPFLLRQSVGSKPHDSEVNVPLVYADYFYLEALHRRKELFQRGRLQVSTPAN